MLREHRFLRVQETTDAKPTLDLPKPLSVGTTVSPLPLTDPSAADGLQGGILPTKLPDIKVEKLLDLSCITLHDLSFMLMHFRGTEVVGSLIHSVESSIRDVTVEMMLSGSERSWILQRDSVGTSGSSAAYML